MQTYLSVEANCVRTLLNGRKLKNKTQLIVFIFDKTIYFDRQELINY